MSFSPFTLFWTLHFYLSLIYFDNFWTKFSLSCNIFFWTTSVRFYFVLSLLTWWLLSIPYECLSLNFMALYSCLHSFFFYLPVVFAFHWAYLCLNPFFQTFRMNTMRTLHILKFGGGDGFGKIFLWAMWGVAVCENSGIYRENRPTLFKNCEMKMKMLAMFYF